ATATSARSSSRSSARASGSQWSQRSRLSRRWSRTNCGARRTNSSIWRSSCHALAAILASAQFAPTITAGISGPCSSRSKSRFANKGSCGQMAFDVSPPRDCGACPRLAEYRAANRSAYPEWSNAPVASFGGARARLMIVGLAPGLRGANRTGRPFTGDYAGDLLYETLIRFGFAAGVYGRRPDDGLELVDCAIVNAVRCAPPQNKPTPQEIAACRTYLSQSIGALPDLKIVLALGRVAHDTVLRAFGARATDFPLDRKSTRLN